MEIQRRDNKKDCFTQLSVALMNACSVRMRVYYAVIDASIPIEERPLFKSIHAFDSLVRYIRVDKHLATLDLDMVFAALAHFGDVCAFCEGLTRL